MSGFDGGYSAGNWHPITPSDTANIEPRCDGLWIGATGDVRAEDAFGRIATFKCMGGTVLPISARRVLATGTTATNIVGLRP